MIYCLNCGKGIPDESKFCTFCGTPTPHVDTQTQSITPPPQQQYVNPTPPPITQQNVNPAPQQIVSVNATRNVAGTKNEFYKNMGFWGAVLALVGFFLPYVNGYDVSFYYLVTDLAPDKPELYLYLVFPVSGAILIIQAFTGIFPGFVVVIFKVLPFLMLLLFAIGISNNSSSFGFMGNDIESVLKNIGVGLYMTVIGTLLMFFFRTTKTRV